MAGTARPPEQAERKQREEEEERRREAEARRVAEAEQAERKQREEEEERRREAEARRIATAFQEAAGSEKTIKPEVKPTAVFVVAIGVGLLLALVIFFAWRMIV